MVLPTEILQSSFWLLANAKNYFETLKRKTGVIFTLLIFCTIQICAIRSTKNVVRGVENINFQSVRKVETFYSIIPNLEWAPKKGGKTTKTRVNSFQFFNISFSHLTKYLFQTQSCLCSLYGWRFRCSQLEEVDGVKVVIFCQRHLRRNSC